MNDSVMMSYQIRAFGGSGWILCQDLKHQQTDGMHPNRNLCRAGLVKLTANDLFPKHGTELTEDFQPLESYGQMYPVECNRHPYGQMMRQLAQIEHDFYDCLTCGSQK